MPVILTGKEVGVFEQFDAFVGNAQRASEEKRADCVRSDDYRRQRQEGIVDESAGVDRNLVEAKNEGQRRGHDCVQAEQRREANEDAD